MVRMAQAHEADNVKLLCGMISADRELFERAEYELADAFGSIDVTSNIMPFDMTHYYDEQMGSPLWRMFISFARTVSPDVLADVKQRTNAIEAEIAAAHAGPDYPPRPINLDPGYIESSKLVLASMKNFSHRIYLRHGVYAEVTLMYRKGVWEALEWTFPDYASGRYNAFLTDARTRLAGRASKGEQR